MIMLRSFRFLLAASLATVALRAETLRLGVVFSGDATPVAWPVVNSGAEPLRIGGTHASCACMEQWVSELVVPAGKTGEISFVHRADKTGRLVVQLEARSGDLKSVVRSATLVGFVAQRSWLVSPAQLRERLAAQDVTVVDVREGARFTEAHIPRAMQILPFAVKTRADLRARKIVLVDEGFAPDVVLALVRGLRETGFQDVVALDGGMAAWVRAGQSVEGSATTPLAVAMISVGDFARASAISEWRILELAAPGATRATIDGATFVADAGAASAWLARPVASGAAVVRPTLVIASDAAARIKIETGGGAKGGVFYLSGGASALSVFQAQASLAQQGAQLVEVRSAPQRSPAAAGGCSSCPK